MNFNSYNAGLYGTKRQIPLKLTLEESDVIPRRGSKILAILRVPADARTTFGDLYSHLLTPAVLANAELKDFTRSEIDFAASSLVADESIESKPFRKLFPNESPSEDYRVRIHPHIDHMWFVLTPQIEVDSSWPSREEAYCAVWELAVKNGDVEPPAPTYAYVGIAVPVPANYHVTFHHQGDDIHPDAGSQAAWYFETENVGSEDFDTELEATIAAWRHMLDAEAKSELKNSGLLKADHHKADYLVVNVPTWFEDPTFVHFIENNNVMTWHERGSQPSDFSDVIVFVDPTLTGEGSEQGEMPEQYWDQLVDLCRAHCSEPAATESRPHIMVRLTNLEM